MFSNKESLNIIVKFSNMYVPVDCADKIMLVPKFMLRGRNTLTVSLKTCLSFVYLLQ